MSDPDRKRLLNIAEKLKSLKSSEDYRNHVQVETAQGSSRKASTSIGYRIVGEMIGGVLLGVVMGYVLDTYFGAGAIGWIVCLLVGVVGGLYNAVKLALKTPSSVQQNSLPPHKTD